MKSEEHSTRITVGLFLGVIILISIFPLDGILFRILYACSALIAIIELDSLVAASNKVDYLAQCETGIILLGAFAACYLPRYLLIIGILSASSTDVFAYAFGKVLGGKIIRSRPFPRISPNKTYEGCFYGVVGQLIVVSLFLHFWPNNSTIISPSVYLVQIFGGIIAIAGDVLESGVKRQAEVKDSNELMSRHGVIGALEKILGGKNGHGGYLDRLDSISLTYSLIFLTFTLSRLISRQ